MVIGYVLKCEKCTHVWLAWNLPKACANCKQRGYGKEPMIDLEHVEPVTVFEGGREILNAIITEPQEAPVERKAREASVPKPKPVKTAVIESPELEEIDDADIPVEAERLGVGGVPLSRQSCPNKAKHGSVMRCKVCDWSAG